jgi:hypothetical protein
LRRIYIRQIDELTATASPFWLTAMYVEEVVEIDPRRKKSLFSRKVEK